MNEQEEVQRIIDNSLINYQYLLLILVVVVILYWLFKSVVSKNKR